MSLWVLAGCVLIGVFAGAFPALWDGWQMRRTRHACRFATADTEVAEPGQILQCPICLRPGRVESTSPAWIVEMTWRERRRWRKATSAV